MNIIEIINKRYSTKKFQTETELSPEQIAQMEQLLQMSASSTNAQPWHFIIATTPEAKKRIAKSTQGFYIFNEHKVLDASAVVVFVARHDVSEEFLQHVLEQEDAQGRFPDAEHKQMNHDARRYFVNMHRDELQDLPHWAEKQLYLNLGSFLVGVAALGLDAIAMEGFDREVLDAEFDLKGKGLSSAVIVPVGYHAEDDFNASLPKSRLPIAEIITRC